MCGKCEQYVAKAGMVLGGVSTLLAVIGKLTAFHPLGAGSRAYAAFAALMYLMAIAANTYHRHE